MPRLRTFVNTYRVRLVLAFALVVAVALGLVLATLPPLLNGYFEQQEQQNLQRRADSVALLVLSQLSLYQTLNSSVAKPLILPGPPLTVGDSVVQALGAPDHGFLADLKITQADVTVAIAASAQEPQPVYTITVPLAAGAGQPGQEREPLTARSQQVPIRDTWWAARPEGAPARIITVTLTNPLTNRAQTAATITSVLLVAAALALLVAIVASMLLAQRLTDPIRRLTHAARSLAEGRLESRVPTVAQSSEVAELAGAFNNMAERLQESIEMISQDRDRSRAFLADVSHELRTPIAALRTFNELLRDGAAADLQTRDEFLEQSARQIERLDWLSTNLLELSKLDSGLVALDLRPDDLRGVVENAVEQAEPVAERKGIALVMKVPPEAVRQLHDPPRMGQVLTNLIGNAIKFTPPGGRVAVELESGREGAQLSVTDTGAGIAPDELPHVFERFYRGMLSGAERGSGSGLGLAIAKSIVDMHQGRISIETSPGSGTQVVVALPRDVTISSPTAARS